MASERKFRLRTTWQGKLVLQVGTLRESDPFEWVYFTTNEPHTPPLIYDWRDARAGDLLRVAIGEVSDGE
jgi:hypothetical protein